MRKKVIILGIFIGILVLGGLLFQRSPVLKGISSDRKWNAWCIRTAGDPKGTNDGFIACGEEEFDTVNVHSVYTIDGVTYEGDITDCELCEEPLSATEMLLLGWRKRSRYLFLTFCPDKPQSMELDIRAAKNGTPYSTHIVLE